MEELKITNNKFRAKISQRNEVKIYVQFILKLTIYI